MSELSTPEESPIPSKTIHHSQLVPLNELRELGDSDEEGCRIEITSSDLSADESLSVITYPVNWCQGILKCVYALCAVSIGAALVTFIIMGAMFASLSDGISDVYSNRVVCCS